MNSYIVCGMLVLAAVAQANPITIYNTGVAADGTPLINSTRDIPEIHYILKVAGGVTLVEPLQAPQVASEGGFPIPPWLGNDSKSAWIGPAGTTQLDGPTGTYDYQTTFDLTGFDPTTVSITGRWATDDSGIDIRLNNVSTNISSVGYLEWTDFTIVHSGPIVFLEGVNTLDFIVSNSGGGPTGLRVEMEMSTPEPASLILLGAGLVAIGIIRRRRS